MALKKLVLGGIFIGGLMTAYADNSNLPSYKLAKLAELQSACNLYRAFYPSSKPNSLKEIVEKVPRYRKLKFDEEEYRYDPITRDVICTPKIDYVIDLWNPSENRLNADNLTNLLKEKGWNAKTESIYWKEDKRSVYHTQISSSTFLDKDELRKRVIEDSVNIGGPSIEDKCIYDEKKEIEGKVIDLMRAIDRKDYKKQASFYSNALLGLDGKVYQTSNSLQGLKISKSTFSLENELQMVFVDNDIEMMKNSLKRYGLKKPRFAGEIEKYDEDAAKASLPFEIDSKDLRASAWFSRKSGMNYLNFIFRKTGNEWKAISIFEEDKSTKEIIPVLGEK